MWTRSCRGARDEGGDWLGDHGVTQQKVGAVWCWVRNGWLEELHFKIELSDFANGVGFRYRTQDGPEGGFEPERLVK